MAILTEIRYVVLMAAIASMAFLNEVVVYLLSHPMLLLRDGNMWFLGCLFWIYGGNMVVRLILAQSWTQAKIRTLFINRFRTPLCKGIRRQIQTHMQHHTGYVREGHPHKTAAENRNAGSATMANLAAILGMTPYIVSPSTREVDYKGTRDYYQLNDLVQAPKHDKVPEDAVIILTDVDYYADMPYWLSYGRPILLYTFVPNTAGGQVPDGIFSIYDNILTTIISGGATYRHYLWDYQADSLWATNDINKNFIWKWVNTIGSMCGWWHSMDMFGFSVDQYKMSDDRRIIALVPFVRLPVKFWNEEATQLKRCTLSFRGKDGNTRNMFRVLTDEGPMITVSRAHEPSSVVLPERIFISSQIRFVESASHHLSDVLRFVAGSTDAAGAAILFDYLKNHANLKPDLTVHQPGEIAKHFQSIAGDVTEDGKTYARRYASAPTTVEAVYPVESRNNEQLCIEKRKKYRLRLCVDPTALRSWIVH